MFKFDLQVQIHVPDTKAPRVISMVGTMSNLANEVLQAAVLTQREIANQEIQTYQKQQAAEEQRILMEQAEGTADMQSQLAQSKVNVDIETNNANAQKAKGEGEASYIRQMGTAKGAEVEAVVLARAKAYQAQVEALGQSPTALVNAITVLAERGIKLIPDTPVMGGNGGDADEPLRVRRRPGREVRGQ